MYLDAAVHFQALFRVSSAYAHPVPIVEDLGVSKLPIAACFGHKVPVHADLGGRKGRRRFGLRDSLGLGGRFGGRLGFGLRRRLRLGLWLRGRLGFRGRLRFGLRLGFRDNSRFLFHDVCDRIRFHARPFGTDEPGGIALKLNLVPTLDTPDQRQ
jgi:hypothetical protein